MNKSEASTTSRTNPIILLSVIGGFSICCTGIAVALMLPKFAGDLLVPVIIGGMAALSGAVSIILSFFVLRTAQRQAKKTKDAWESERQVLLDYIDATWQTHRRFIQEEKISSLLKMVSGVAHELNTPIGNASTAHSFLNSLQGQDPRLPISEPRVTHMLEIIGRNLDRCNNLIASFKKTNSDHLYSEKQAVSLSRIISFAISQVRSQRGIQIKDLRIECPSTIVLTIESMPLAIVLENLVENAVIHAYKNETGPLFIRAETKKLDLMIHVEDHGEGVVPQFQNTLFDPFVSSLHGEGHFGLGLAISYNLTYRHYHGEITYEALDPKGSRFTIILPNILPHPISHAHTIPYNDAQATTI